MTRQLDRWNAARTWIVFLVAFASSLLAGCNQTSATGSAAQSSSPPAAAQSPPTPTSAASTNGTADLSWTAPTTNTDGSALTDLAGYRIYYGTSPTALNDKVDIANVSTTSYVITGLQQGTWYFAVEAYTNTGLESSLSQVVNKTIS